jgi:hypothetical protein
MRLPCRNVRGAAIVVLVLASGCSDATGTVRGGEALIASNGDAGAATFTSLYADFFGPSGQATCTAQAGCHGTAGASGAQTSGFVCGQTKESCWEGMTKGINPVDAGGPVVCVGICPQNTSFTCPTDPTKQTLYGGLHKVQAAGLNNMPCSSVPVCRASQSPYTFTQDDLARISTWIQQGAQDN